MMCLRGLMPMGSKDEMEEAGVKITIFMGSPNRKGSTNILAEEFMKGAEEAGHTCDVIDVCHDRTPGGSMEC